MIRMIVDRPLREYDIRPQRREQFGEGFVVCIVHNRSAVALWCKDGCCAKDAARRHRFLNTRRYAVGGNCRGTGGRAIVRVVATVEIQQRDAMALLCVPRDRSAAAVFRIAGVAAGVACRRAQRHER
jgi:hypothetical protein